MLFDYLSEAEHNKIIILSTNLEFSRWVNVLYNEQMTATLFRRLTYHCHLLLEEEMVRWRQALIKHLSPLDAQNLHADIFDNLVRRNSDNEAYQAYLNAYGYKEDPMEAREHTEKLWRLRNGADETSVNL